MAKLEDLIKNIPDAKLRDEIAREAAQLKAEKKFGLVFEEHIPELAQLPSLPPRAGDRVCKRGGKMRETFRVVAQVNTRKPWALCVPYRMDGDDKPVYPDLIVFRKVGGEIVADILDPHNSGLPDAVDKAKGLAEYAKKHGEHFGRIEIIAMDANGKLQRLNLNDETTREDVLRMGSRSHLEQLLRDAP